MEKQLSVHRGGHLEALLDGCPDAIIAIDADGIVKFANKQACKLTERSMNELIGESIVLVYENKEAAREANRKIYEGGGTLHNYETKMRTKSGKLIPVRLSASHLKDSSGKTTGGVGYFAPYRPWAGAEADVKARVEELEGSLESCRALAAPIFELCSGMSVMQIAGNIDADTVENITSKLLSHVEGNKSRVVLIDLSDGKVTDDGEVAGKLTRMIRTIRLLGAECVVAGMSASLARAMEALMGDLRLVRAFSCMEPALQEALGVIGYELHEKS